MVRNSTKHIQDEVRTPEMVEPILEIYEAACGAPLTERPYFSVTNCTIAPLQHDREMTEAGAQAGRPRRAHLRAAHAAGRHHGADDAARHLHPQHGRAAQRHRALPAGAPRLRAHLRGGLRRRRHALRRVHRLEPGDRAHQPDLPGDEPVLRAADAGHRHVGRRQGGRLPGGLGGRHDGARGRPRRRRLAHLRRRARRRADLEPRQVRARQRPDRRAAPLPARGPHRRDHRAHGRHPRGGHRRALPRAQEHAAALAHRGVAAAGVPARDVRGVRRALARRRRPPSGRARSSRRTRCRRCPRTSSGTSTTSSRAAPPRGRRDRPRVR